jgi:glycosyltransferase involved in cell wall biosynthesis
VVFLSEYEGLPLALLEALAAGVVPVFPKIQSGGDAYTLGVDASLLYPAGDLTSIIPILRQLSRQTEPEWAALRARATASVAKHTGSHYLNAFASFVRDISNAPPLVPSPLGPRPFRWMDYCPFALMRRLHPLGFWQPGDRPG